MIQRAVQHLKQGDILAYPTEAVYGLGCDPTNHQALVNLLYLKRRTQNKGLILIASDISQIEFYIDFSSIPQSIK